MKTHYLMLSMAVSVAAHAQIDYKVLEQNNVSAHISNSGILFYDSTAQAGAYEVPKGGGNTAIYGAQFWYGGQDVNGTNHLSLGGLNPANTDVFPGPYSSQGIYSNNQNWKVWTICQSDIDVFKAFWEAGLPGSDTTATVIEPSEGTMMKIMSWPGNGDVTIGQDYWVAPFYDRNQDGIYDPMSGDYPIIKGCCATFMVQNDAGGLHTLSGTAPVGLEMRYLVYQYESNDYINDATFIDVMAINRGSTTYNDFAYGLLIDSDLGYGMDDYVGSDSTSSMLYFYNGDNNDENHYGANPPALGIVSLLHPASGAAPFTGNLTQDQAWNVLTGKQSSGDPWTHPDNYPTGFVYSGDPTNAAEWSELGINNPVGDRRGIITKHYGNLSAGDTIYESYAILYARTGDHVQNVQSLTQQATDVKLFYQNDTLMCSAYSAAIPEKQKLEFELQPNPSTGLIHLECEAQGKLEVKILQADGKTVFSTEFKATEKTLDLTALPKGLYFLQLSMEKSSSTQKIILQ